MVSGVRMLPTVGRACSVSSRVCSLFCSAATRRSRSSSVDQRSIVICTMADLPGRGPGPGVTVVPRLTAKAVNFSGSTWCPDPPCRAAPLSLPEPERPAAYELATPRTAQQAKAATPKAALRPARVVHGPTRSVHMPDLPSLFRPWNQLGTVFQTLPENACGLRARSPGESVSSPTPEAAPTKGHLIPLPR